MKRLILLIIVVTITILNSCLPNLYAEQMLTINRVYEDEGIQKVEISLPPGSKVNVGSKGKVYFIDDYDNTESIVADIEVLSVTGNVARAKRIKGSNSIKIKEDDIVRFLPQTLILPEEEVLEEMRDAEAYLQRGDANDAKPDHDRTIVSRPKETIPTKQKDDLDKVLATDYEDIKSIVNNINEAIRFKNVEKFCRFLTKENRAFYLSERKIMENFVNEIQVLNSSFNNVSINIDGNTANVQYLWNMDFKWKVYPDKEFKNKCIVSLKLKKNSNNWEISDVNRVGSYPTTEASSPLVPDAISPSVQEKTATLLLEDVKPGKAPVQTEEGKLETLPSERKDSKAKQLRHCNTCNKEVGESHICWEGW